MAKYVFISNSTKPSAKEYESLEPIKLVNVNRPCLEAAVRMGYDVILGVNRKHPNKLNCKELNISFYNSHTYRNIFAVKDNYIAYKNLCNLLKQGDVEVIHCNTPIGGFMGRVCGRKYKVPKIIYTAHGFHFFKGASFLNNTILKWVEHMLAHWTDVIITMNEEDYLTAQKMRFKKNGKVYKVSGVGIDLNDYQNVRVDYESKRKELGIKIDDFVCIAMGDLVKRKNFKLAIESIYRCNDKSIHYIICGDGPEKDSLIKITKNYGLERQIHFLGFRNDIKDLLNISDCFLFTSLQEGLPRSTMEAMASGLSCIVTNSRGNKDLIDNELGGFLSNDAIELSEKIKLLKSSLKMQQAFGKYNQKKIKHYDIKVVKEEIKLIYREVLEGKKI